MSISLEDYIPDPLTLVKHAADAVQAAVSAGTDDPLKFLNHALVSEKGSTGTAYADIKSGLQAKLYAAAGFHASVTAGLTKTGNAKLLWGRAARAYFLAFDAVRAAIAANPLNAARAMSANARSLLDTANAAAEVARIGGGKTSSQGDRSDPTKPPEPTAPPADEPAAITTSEESGSSTGRTVLYVGAGILGVLGLAALMKKKGKRSAARATDTDYDDDELEAIAADLAEQAEEFT